MLDDGFFRVDYTFSAFLSEGSAGEDPTDFVSEIFLNLYRVSEEKGTELVVGKGSLSLLHLNRAMDQDFPLFDVFDATASIQAMAGVIFNMKEEEDYWSKLDELYDYDIPTNFDVCFIERIELLPEFRGKGVGKWLIQNILERFYGSCGLVVINAFPLQHEDGDSYSPEWTAKMKLEALESDLEKAQYKLFHYYQQLGFSNPFEQDYFLIRPEEFDFEQFWDEEYQ